MKRPASTCFKKRRKIEQSLHEWRRNKGERTTPAWTLCIIFSFSSNRWVRGVLSPCSKTVTRSTFLISNPLLVLYRYSLQEGETFPVSILPTSRSPAAPKGWLPMMCVFWYKIKAVAYPASPPFASTHQRPICYRPDQGAPRPLPPKLKPAGERGEGTGSHNQEIHSFGARLPVQALPLSLSPAS